MKLPFVRNRACKYPIWIKDCKTGKYELIPYHLMTSYPDGSRGFSVPTYCDSHTALKFHRKYRDYFDYQDRGMDSRFVFLGKRKKPMIGYLAVVLMGAAAAVTIISLCYGEWPTALVSTTYYFVNASMARRYLHEVL
jgi:hypothetical protein